MTYAQHEVEIFSVDSVKALLSKNIRTGNEVEYLLKVLDAPLVGRNEKQLHELLFNVLSALKQENNWKTQSWQKYRLYYEAIELQREGKFQEAVEKYKQYISLRDKEGLIMGLLGPLGDLRIILEDRHNERLTFYREKLSYYLENGPKENVATCYHGIAGYYYFTGNYNTAIRYYLLASEYYKEWAPREYGNEMGVVGHLYQRWGNMDKAEEYLQKGIEISLREKDYENISFTHISLARVLTVKGELERSLTILQEALNITEKYRQHDELNKVLIMTEISGVYLAMDSLEQSRDYLERASKSGENIDWTFNMNTMYELDYNYFKFYIRSKEWKAAEKSLLAALAYAEENDFPVLKQKYLKELVGFYNTRGNHKKSSLFSLQYIALSDSLSQVNNENAIAKYEMEKLDLDRNQEILQIEHKRKNNQLYFGMTVILLLMFLGGLYSRNRFIHKSRSIIQKEKDRSEKLLLNILPAEIAEELKENGKASARNYNMVSILFTDFKEFTQISEKMTAKELVDEINHCFEAFDGICDKYNIEKIKTIGDAYMAAGGLPVPSDDATTNVVLAALEMSEFILARKKERKLEGSIGFEMRVGIHTGNVVAGIVGIKKFQYDVWGDTVNTASRMESNGVVGKVNISEFTYEKIKSDKRFVFTPRGKITVKGKGDIHMWFVRSAHDSN
jgi:class 3 adenylate cyclase/tetratricopeptide (TPR) repeat protein